MSLRTRRLARSLIAIGRIIGVLLLMLLLPARAPAQKRPAEVIRIAAARLDTLASDTGAVRGYVDFTVRNVGSTPLALTRVEGTCGVFAGNRGGSAAEKAHATCPRSMTSRRTVGAGDSSVVTLALYINGPAAGPVRLVIGTGELEDTAVALVRTDGRLMLSAVRLDTASAAADSILVRTVDRSSVATPSNTSPRTAPGQSTRNLAPPGGTTYPTQITLTPASGFTTTSPNVALRVDWCDRDDAIVGRMVTWQGLPLPDTFVRTYSGNCMSSGYSTWNVVASPGTQTFQASALDAYGHEPQVSSLITYDPPPPPPNPAFSIAAAAQSLTESSGSGGNVASWTVSNTGNRNLTLQYGFGCAGVVIACRAGSGAPASGVVLGVSQTLTIPGSFDVGSLPLFGSVGLDIVATSTDGATVHHGDTVSVRIPSRIAVSVSPTSLALTLAPAVSDVRQTFTITNTGNDTSAFNYIFTCAGAALTCSAQSGRTATIGPSQSVATVVHLATNGVNLDGTGTFSVTSTNQGVTGQGALSVHTTVPTPIIVQAAAVNPGSTIARDDCLTIAAGDGAAYECGDLRLVHDLPSVTTLNHEHTPSLIYSSVHAVSTTIVGADVSMPPSTIATRISATLVVYRRPDSVMTTLDTTWSSAWNNGLPHRIGVRLDASALSLPTGAYRYLLQVRALSSVGTINLGSDTGTVVIVDRSASPFGRGWWLDGLEMISLATPDTSQRLWIGGDGSTRLYEKVPGTGDRKWAVRPMVDRPDTLERTSDGGYVRWLRDSAHVRFDALGRHTATINRERDSTVFAYASGSALAAIGIPAMTETARPWYQFTYGSSFGGIPLLTAVSGPPIGTTGRTVTIGYVTTTNLLDTLTDPDLSRIRFLYTGNQVTARVNRLGVATSYAYDQAGKLRRSTINMASSAEPNIATTYCAAESRGIGSCPLRVDAVGVYTFVDGPRTDVGDTTRFYLDRYGQPDTVVDALGGRTVITRDVRFPLLASSVTAANGHIVRATYNARGLMDTQTDVAPYGGADAVTRYVWNRTWSELDTLVSPTGETTRFGYFANGDRQWQEDGRGLPSRATYTYDSKRRVAAVTTPGELVATTRMDYDATLGNLLHVTSPTGIVTTYQTDAIGRVSKVTTPIDGSHNRVHTYVFDQADRVKTERDSAPSIPYSIVDLGGDASRATLVTTNVYDKEGYVTSTTRTPDPEPDYWTDQQEITTYDAAHRPIIGQHLGQAKQYWQHDPAGNVTASITQRGDTIRMTYDALNRQRTRTTPQVVHNAEAGGDQPPEDPNPVPMFPFFGPNGFVFDQLNHTNTPPPLVIAADVATFDYDAVGNLRHAQNSDARVMRSYYPNGALQSDTLEIALYDPTAWAADGYGSHLFVLNYGYDLSGRRVARSDNISGATQRYHYDAASGLLDSTSDGAAQFWMTYDGAGRLAQRGTAGGGILEGYHYDTEGRLETDTIKTSVRTVFADALGYDVQNHVTEANVWSSTASLNDIVSASYSGLGALVAYRHLRNGVLSTNEYEPDALGNVIAAHPWYDGQRYTDSSQYGGGSIGLSGTTPPVYVFGNPPPAAPLDSAIYGGDAAGNTTMRVGHVRTWPNRDGEWIWSTTGASWEWSVYGADERLRVTQRSDRESGLRTVFTEYRYDPLGRRILSRTRWNPTCVRTATTPTPACLSTIQRYVWDGDQLLYELRADGSESQTADALESPTSSGSFLGSVRYLHAGDIDSPLAIYSNTLGWVVPHKSWRGVYEDASSLAGASESQIAWPSRNVDAYSAPDQRRPVIQESTWLGTLTTERAEPSGLIYMRNRYYDPRTGHFTQSDPLGFAGGNNLFGFAGGDPVNYDDPFGLCTFGKDCIHEFLSGLECGRVGDCAGATSQSWVYKYAKGLGMAVSIINGSNFSYLDDAAIGGAITAYKRPSGATTPEQRQSVQGQPCARCGEPADKMFAGHKKALVEEHYETGTIDRMRMRSKDAVQAECPSCSGREGAQLKQYSLKKKRELGIP